MEKFYRKIRISKTRTNLQGFSLNYYITKMIVEIEGNSVLTYGISIIKNFLDEKQLIRWEKRTVNNIALREEEIYDFAERLYKNKVTPIHLLDIAEDYVAECEENGILRPEGLKLAC